MGNDLSLSLDRAVSLSESVRTNSLRGLACLLLVFHHALGDVIGYLKVDFPVTQRIDSFLAPVRMPLFTMLSGYVYALRPVEILGLHDFIVAKTRRIIVPFIFMTVVYLGLKSVVPSVSVPENLTNLPFYLIFGYSHLWFLQAAFIIFLFAALVDAYFSAQRNSISVFVFVLGIFAHYFMVEGGQAFPFSLDNAIYLLPFFYLGILAQRFSFRQLLPNKKCYVLGAASAGVAIYIILRSDIEFQHETEITLLFSIIAILLLHVLFPAVASLSWIGRFSFTIYLLHPIFMALSLRLGKLQSDLRVPEYALLIGLIFSLLGPISIEVIATKFFPKFLFLLGQKTRAS